MENFDVRALFEEAAKPPEPPMIMTKSWNADLAYARLKVVRDVKDQLSEGINNSSIEIPDLVAQKYEEIWRALKTVEQMEIDTVRYGR